MFETSKEQSLADNGRWVLLGEHSPAGDSAVAAIASIIGAALFPDSLDWQACGASALPSSNPPIRDVSGTEFFVPSSVALGGIPAVWTIGGLAEVVMQGRSRGPAIATTAYDWAADDSLIVP